MKEWLWVGQVDKYVKSHVKKLSEKYRIKILEKHRNIRNKRVLTYLFFHILEVAYLPLYVTPLAYAWWNS